MTAYFTDDATFMPAIGMPTYSGIEEIRNALTGFLKVMTMLDIEIVHLSAVGNVVLTERIDRAIVNGHQHDAWGMGAFEVAGDKITAHRDYFPSGDLA